MRLARVSIEGFRSIEKKLETVIDPHVTVLLGANDHGKTNFLDALRLMNREHGFEPDDLNWDCTGRAEELPAIEFVLDLNENERRELVQLDIAQRLETAAVERSVERQGEIEEIDEEVTKADGDLKGAEEEVEAAARSANDAREALQADPESDEAKKSYAVAQEASHRAKEEAAKVRKAKEGLAARAAEASLALALAEARVRQAKGLREGGQLEDASVEEAAEEAEGVAGRRRKH
jgi:chromosome segregation ATPase